MADPQTLRDIARAINKEHKRDVIVTASDLYHQVQPRTTTGVLSLDVALGGGFALNQWHEIYGEESSGKTALALQTIARNQQLDPDYNVLWVASEEFVVPYAAMAGVDLTRVEVADTNLMEEAFSIMLDYMAGRAVDCIVLDSYPNLVPGEEAEKAMTEFTTAVGARMVGKFFRKARNSGARSLTVEDRPLLGIIINQPRVKIGGWAPHGQDPLTTPGGKAKNFSYFSRIVCRRDDWLDNGMKGRSKVKVGQTIKARVLKNKSGPPERVAEFDFYFEDWEGHEAGKIDYVKDVFTAAVLTGVIEQSAAWFSYDEESWQGRSNAAQALADDPDLVASIEKDVRIVLEERARGVAS